MVVTAKQFYEIQKSMGDLEREAGRLMCEGAHLMALAQEKEKERAEIQLEFIMRVNQEGMEKI